MARQSNNEAAGTGWTHAWTVNARDLAQGTVDLWVPAENDHAVVNVGVRVEEPFRDSGGTLSSLTLDAGITPGPAAPGANWLNDAQLFDGHANYRKMTASTGTSLEGADPRVVNATAGATGISVAATATGAALAVLTEGRCSILAEMRY